MEKEFKEYELAYWDSLAHEEQPFNWYESPLVYAPYLTRFEESKESIFDSMALYGATTIRIPEVLMPLTLNIS